MGVQGLNDYMLISHYVTKKLVVQSLLIIATQYCLRFYSTSCNFQEKTNEHTYFKRKIESYHHHQPPSQEELGKICKQFVSLQVHHHGTEEHLHVGSKQKT